jgi:hypothetical protein
MTSRRELISKLIVLKFLKKLKIKKMKKRKEYNEKRILLYRSGEIRRYEFIKSMCKNLKKMIIFVNVYFYDF